MFPPVSVEAVITVWRCCFRRRSYCFPYHSGYGHLVWPHFPLSQWGRLYCLASFPRLIGAVIVFGLIFPCLSGDGHIVWPHFLVLVGTVILFGLIFLSHWGRSYCLASFSPVSVETVILFGLIFPSHWGRSYCLASFSRLSVDGHSVRYVPSIVGVEAGC